MSEAEVTAIWEAASKIHQPTPLLTKWEKRRDPNASLRAFVRDLRRCAKTAELDDPKTAPEYVARLMEGLVKRFERLVEAGKLDDALPKLSGLPMLYSTEAGTGATHWKPAHDLYLAKRVGVDGPLQHRGVNSASAAPPWRELAADAVWVVQAAVVELAHFQHLRAQAESGFQYEMGRKRGKKKSHGLVLRLPGNELLRWPDCSQRAVRNAGRSNR